MQPLHDTAPRVSGNIAGDPSSLDLPTRTAMITAVMTDTEKRLRDYGLQHFEIDEKLRIITISDHEEFVGLRGLIDPAAEITIWADDDDEFSGQSFRSGRYQFVILAEDIPSS